MENLDYKELRRLKASSNRVHKTQTAKKIISSCKLTDNQEMLKNIRSNNFKKQNFANFVYTSNGIRKRSKDCPHCNPAYGNKIKHNKYYILNTNNQNLTLQDTKYLSDNKFGHKWSQFY